jgi:alkyl hydroperoxide reductase subunit AhpC
MTDFPLPDMTIAAYDPKNMSDTQLRLKDLRSKFSVIFFYPADYTFVCPTELKDLAAHKSDFEKLGANVVTVSTDTVYTHKAWIEEEELLNGFDYLMAADHNGALARALGIYNEGSGEAERATFIVDPDGVVRAVYVVTDRVGRSAGEIVRLVRALKYVRENPGISCPASWDESKPTLKPNIAISGKVGQALRQGK